MNSTTLYLVNGSKVSAALNVSDFSVEFAVGGAFPLAFVAAYAAVTAAIAALGLFIQIKVVF